MLRVRAALAALLVSLLASGCGSSSSDATQASTRAARESPSPSGQRSPVAEDADPDWVTGRVTTGSQPCGILGAAGRIWVSDYGNDDLVSVDPRTLHVGRSIPVGTHPCGLAHGAGSIWVEDFGSGEVTRVSARSGHVQDTYRVGLSPYDVAFASGAAWVTNNGDGTVSRVDATTGKVTRIHTGGTPTGIAPAGGLVWTGLGAAGIAAIDPATGKVVHRIRTPRPAGWTAYDARRVWVCVGSQVWVVDGRSGRVTSRLAAGPQPLDGSVVDGVVWVPDGNGSLRRYGRGVSSRPVTSGVGNPFVLAGYRGRVWVVDFNGTDVVRIDPSRVG